MDVTILGDDGSKMFYWPDALLAAKPPMEMDPLSACVWAMRWMWKYR